ncbi:MAG: hypothetical protein P8J32_01165 [bacterium]|nr:hypothetical protein [bacterium]
MRPGQAFSLAQVHTVVHSSAFLREKLQMYQGFYVPQGRCAESLVAQRLERHVDAERKYRLLHRAARYFQLLPAVRASAAVNTMALWSTARSSDIDLFIVTRPGYIWSSRFWLVLPFLFMGHRPTHHEEEGEEVEDPFCFSFFSSQNDLQMGKLCLDRDPYMAFWVKSVVPVFDRDASFEQFHDLNRWASTLFPNVSARVVHPYHEVKRLPCVIPQLRFSESIFRSVQRARMPESLTKLANQDTRVVIHDGMLKFHVNDRRAQYRDTHDALVKEHVC